MVLYLFLWEGCVILYLLINDYDVYICIFVVKIYLEKYIEKEEKIFDIVVNFCFIFRYCCVIKNLWE